MDHLLNMQSKKLTEEEEAKLNLNLTPKTLARKYSNLEKEIESVFKQGKPSLKIFGICGGPSCGKSKITKYFSNKIDKSIVIAEKDFFREITKTPRKGSFYEDKENMFAVSNDEDGYSKDRKQRLIESSDADSYNWDSLIVALTKLKNNESVVLPYYDYENEVLVKQCREILSAQVSMVFVEGMFIYKIAKLRELFDFNIFVEVDEDIRLSRMLIHENRFMKSNPKALKSFFIIYEKFIKGSYEVNVEPTKKYANLIFPNFDITPDDEIENNPSLEFLLLNLQNMIKHRLTLIMHSKHLGIEK